MPAIRIAPSEQALINFALLKLLGTALVSGPIQIYCSPELTLSFSPAQIRELIGKVQL
jgi:hypothetical protein